MANNSSEATPVSIERSSVLKRLDVVVFRCETVLVTVAALIMTSTVCLDIFSRLLRSQQSFEFAWVMSGFGLFSDVSSNLGSSLMPVVALLVIPLFLGSSAYSAQHRGEDKLKARALKHGLWWTLGVTLSSIFICQAPSRIVCLALSIGVGGALIYKRVGSPPLIGVLSALLSWGAWQLPQGYIWSQELSLILLAWVAFLGASMATHEHKHIKVSAFAKLIPTSLRGHAEAIGLILTGLFAAYLAVSLFGSVFGARGSFVSGETRPSTGLPAWIILFAGVVAFTTITARSLAYGVHSLLNPQSNISSASSHDVSGGEP